MGELGFLNEFIPKRKSFRTFDMDKPLGDELLEDLVDFLSGLTMPQDDIDWNFDTLPYNDMVSIAAVEPAVKAPMYLVLRAERVKFCLQNSGYLGELAALWLTSRGVGTCWQGTINVTEDFPDTLPYITTLAFGWSDEPFRSPDEKVDRKAVSKITIGDFSGSKLDIATAVRLAPSFMNRQPVCLMSMAGRIHIFRNHVILNSPAISYAQCIDTGAAMAHLRVAADAAGNEMKFVKQSPTPTWNKKIYQATAAFDGSY